MYDNDSPVMGLLYIIAFFFCQVGELSRFQSVLVNLGTCWQATTYYVARAYSKPYLSVAKGCTYPLNNPGEMFCAIPHLVNGGDHRQAVPSMVGCCYD